MSCAFQCVCVCECACACVCVCVCVCVLKENACLCLPFIQRYDRCNEVDMYGKKEAGTGKLLNTFNQINKHE